MPPNNATPQYDHSEQTLHELILSYLVHHGYTGTAKAVVQDAKYVSSQDLLLSSDTTNESDMEQRQYIRSAIVHGKIEEAIHLIDTYFPGLLEEEERGQELQLRLKCGKFVEMMREYCDQNKTRRLRTNSMDGGDAPPVVETRSKSISGPSTRRRLSYASIASGDPMDVDKPSEPYLPKGSIWARKPSISGLSDEHLKPPSDGTEAANYLKVVMQYGQQLQEEYRHDTREKTRSRLVVIKKNQKWMDTY